MYFCHNHDERDVYMLYYLMMEQERTPLVEDFKLNLWNFLLQKGEFSLTVYEYQR